MYIYEIRNIKNGKSYIGQTTSKNRFANHKSALKHKKHHNPHLQNAWNKYGKDNFTFNILHMCSSINELNKKEIEYIKKYNSIENGYNIMGGGNNCKQEKEYIKKRTASLKKEIFQYDLDGNFIKRFDSIKEASKKVNTVASNIGLCANGKQKTAGGYRWFFKKQKKLEPILTAHKMSIKTRKNNSWNNGSNKKVLQFKDNKYIRSYESITEACKDNKISRKAFYSKIYRNKDKNKIKFKNFEWEIV